MYISATDIKTPQSKELQHTKIHKATLVIVFIVFLTQKTWISYDLLQQRKKLLQNN